MELTEEQKQRIEKNKQEALLRRKQSEARLQAQRQLSAVSISTGQPQQHPSGPPLPQPRPAFSGPRVPFNTVHSIAPISTGVIDPLVRPHASASASFPNGSVTQSVAPAPVQFRPVTGPRLPQCSDYPRQPPPKPLPVRKVKASAVVTSKNRVEIHSPYCAQLIETFKRFKTKQYDTAKRIWSFEFSDYETLERTIRTELGNYVEFEGLARFVVDILVKGRHKRTPAQDVDLAEKIPDSLLLRLLPYQVEGVTFAVRNGGRILLADDMGLGKTVQAIATAAYFKNDWPVLCLTPSSVRFEWREQWLRWIPTLKPQNIVVVTNSKQSDQLANAHVVITTYDLLVSMKKHFLPHTFPFLICDESHALKSYKAQRTKVVSEVAKKAVRILLLSGTPALSRPVELYSQIELLDRTIFRTFPDYAKRYCDAHVGSFGHMDYSGMSNVEELQLILEATVMIRRMKKDVASQLPDKTRSIVVLDPGKVQFPSELSSSAESFREMQSHSASYAQIRKTLLTYFQHTGKAKLPAVVDYLKDLLEENSSLKMVIFAHHTQVVKEIHESLGGDSHGITIDGSTPTETRKHLCDKFQRDNTCRSAVLSITACCTGITLTAASLVVFAELYWNPGILVQAEDRLHRLGQQNNVMVRYLVAKQTADDELWPLLKRKLEFLNDVGLSTDNFNNIKTTIQHAEVDSAKLEKALEDEGDGENGPPFKRTRTDENIDMTGFDSPME
ncbi:SWI/SNF-related matrix-associated actin-dependent regulator of chromatin subfamily A-like protein 1 [Paramacrobiotus metropolitanus]|uniref:SWI/SNF-related matrix-associated actin-dependent regulator of chromatin subfamily A-like protein 1 n=1 Tax=Paramacrobiotus metropolitanus TaxID=2943436 RepID=UPI002445952F|nr:SWI/SNF-related matrix-associated actin-dependent regulator of chromatin subfamily A-like protein 1 [Paramacrobiotus metropolitanus]